jgi:hypothetical protein
MFTWNKYYTIVVGFEIIYILERFLHSLGVLSNSTEQHICSWEADSCWGDQEITRILWSPNVHDTVYKLILLDPILSQMETYNLVKAYF